MKPTEKAAEKAATATSSSKPVPKFTFRLGAYDMIEQGIKKIEFRKDNPKNRLKIQQKKKFIAYRGPSFSPNTLPHMEVEIISTHLLPPTYKQTLIYPNHFKVDLEGPLIAIEIGRVLTRGGPLVYERWSPYIINRIFY